MLLNVTNLRGLFDGFNMAFNQGFEGVTPLWPRIAMKTNSIHAQETYPWLGQIPMVREWVGPRQVNNLSLYGYAIANADFESTVSVPRNTIEDDTYGVMTPMFADFGRMTAEHPDTLVAKLLSLGFSSNCYDGQFFFDGDHPVTDENGAATSISNVQAGAGEPWFLLDTTRAIRPLIYQERRPFRLIKKDNPEDDNVFMNKEFLYGTDGRSNAGYGLWQLAFGSKATLDATNYGAARAAMQKFKGDRGRKLGIRPNVLVVGPDNEEEGRKLLSNELASGGESNPWKGTAEVIVSPWIG